MAYGGTPWSQDATRCTRGFFLLKDRLNGSYTRIYEDSMHGCDQDLFVNIYIYRRTGPPAGAQRPLIVNVYHHDQTPRLLHFLTDDRIDAFKVLAQR